MTDESPTGGNSPEDRDNQHSDLTTIKGIGAVRQQLLVSIGINTIADLAAASVEEIESRLQAAGHVINHSEISDWLVQAREILQEQLSSQVEVPASNVSDEGSASEESNTIEEGNAEEWNSFASFVVEFQSKTVAEQTEQRTVASQQNSDQVTIWSEIETEQLPQWLQQQLSEVISPEPAPELPGSATPLLIEIEQLRLLQPPQTRIPLISKLEMFPGSLNSNKPFILEVSWKLSGAIPDEVNPSQLRYRIQAYARDRTTGRVNTISETLPIALIDDQSSYNSVLPETSLPAGIYRLQLLITLQGKLAPPAFLEVPLLQVV